MLPLYIVSVLELPNPRKYDIHYLSVEQYDFLTVIGRGAFGKVFLARKLKDRKKYYRMADEIKELEWKSDNGLGVWSSEGKTEDERINNLWEKVQDYMGVYLTSLEYCNNRPHPLTAYK